jgi:hypothetical protein
MDVNRLGVILLNVNMLSVIMSLYRYVGYRYAACICTEFNYI